MITNQIVKHRKRHIRIDSTRAIAQEQRNMHHLANLTTLHNQSRLHTLAHTDEIMMDSTHRQQRRNRRMLRIDIAVAQNDIIHPLVHALLSPLTQRIKLATQRTLPPTRVKQDRQLNRVEALIADITQHIQVRVSQHRLRQTHHLTVRLIRHQHTAPHTTDILRQRHHKLLTNRIDSRIRHLRKLLSEIVKQNLRTITNHRQRRIITHSRHRLLPRSTHRNQRTVDILLPKAKSTQLPLIVSDPILNLTTTFEFLKLNTIRRQPMTIRMLMSQPLLNLTIIINTPLQSINQQNLTRLQPTLAHHIARLEIHDPHLARHDHQPLLRNRIARRTQTITIQHTTSETPIRKHQRSRPVPRLHQDRIILIESLQVFTDRILVVKRLRHQDSHSLRQAHAAHHQKLKDIIQTRRITHILLHDRTNIPDVAQSLTTQHTLASLHPATVAPHSINLTIVTQEAERLRQFPLRESISTETAMHQRQARSKIIIAQIREEPTQLTARKHTLIDNILRRQRTNIKSLPLRLRKPETTHTPLYTLTNLIENTLKNPHLLLRHPRDEDLLDIRHHLPRSHTRHLLTHRHTTQMHQQQPLTLDLLDHHTQDKALALHIARQEHQPRTIPPLLRHRNTLQQDKLMRNLQQDTSTIARLVARLSPTMLHILQHPQSIVHQVMALCAMNIDHHTHSTSIMLIVRAVKSLS